MKHSSQFRRLLLTTGAAALIVMIITTLTACERKTQAQVQSRAATTVPVILKPLKILPVQRAVDVVGMLYGDEETVVSAKVPGRIIALYKDIGDTVAPGEPLVQLKQNEIGRAHV